MVSTPALVYVSAASVLLPLLVVIAQWRLLNSLEKRIAWLLVANTLIQGLALLLAEIWKVNNMPVYHVYLILEFNLLFGIYYYGIFKGEKRSIWKMVAVASLLIFAVNGLWIESFTSFPSYLRSLEALLATSLAVAYFIKKLSVTDTKPLFSDPAFWMSTGVFIYYTTNLLLFMYGQVLQNQPEVFRHTWIIHGYLNILLYTLYTFAMLCRKKTWK